MSLLASSLAGANYMTSSNEDRESATNGAAEFTRRKKWPEILLKELVGGSIFCLKPVKTRRESNQQGSTNWSWKIVYSSPAVIEMLGQKPADLEGKDFLDLVFSADHSQIQTFFHHLLTPALPHHSSSSSTTMTTSSSAFNNNNAPGQNSSSLSSSLLSDSQTTYIRMLSSNSSNSNSPESSSGSNSNSNSNSSNQNTPSKRGGGPIIWELRAHASGLGNDESSSTTNNISGTENLGLTSQNGTVVQQNNLSADNSGIGMKGKAIWVMGRRVNEVPQESDIGSSGGNGSGNSNGNGNGNGGNGNQSLDAFLELKLENERLREELRELQLDLDEELPARKSSGPNISPHKPSNYNNLSSSGSSRSSSPSSSRSSSPTKIAAGISGSSTLNTPKVKGKTGRPPKEGKEPKDKEKEKMEKKRKKSLANGGNGKEGEGMHVCVTCGRTDSPEWRKGPLGPKTLCNACGLRWAKRNSNQPTRKDRKPNDVKK